MATEVKQERYETSVRMPMDLYRQVRTVADVEGISLNKLIVQAVQEAIIFYQGDDDFNARYKAWLDERASLGST